MALDLFVRREGAVRQTAGRWAVTLLGWFFGLAVLVEHRSIAVLLLLCFFLDIVQLAG